MEKEQICLMEGALGERLKREYHLLGVIKRLAVAKKGLYDGLAAVEQAPNSELAKEYNMIAESIISYI